MDPNNSVYGPVARATRGKSFDKVAIVRNLTAVGEIVFRNRFSIGRCVQQSLTINRFILLVTMRQMTKVNQEKALLNV